MDEPTEDEASAPEEETAEPSTLTEIAGTALGFALIPVVVLGMVAAVCTLVVSVALAMPVLVVIACVKVYRQVGEKT